MTTPTHSEILAIRRECKRSHPYGGGDYEPHVRRVSTAFAEELRSRGWLHEEGYAVGSWATKGDK